MYVRQILDDFVFSARNCLASSLHYSEIQMGKVNSEKGYCTRILTVTQSTVSYLVCNYHKKKI